jgi:cation diffusion facilitator CzcD-associated flavoprotein CzcO
MDPEIDIAIVGAGFSGLGMAIRLKQQGREGFVVLERAPDVGGTWHFNTYPGCACDIPSHLYSFSFAPNPDWSETYSSQPEIREYLRTCADRFGIRPHIRFGCEVESAEWDEDAGRWTIQTSEGELRARVLIGGMGPLFEPKLPQIPGLESFEGALFHSARWNHDYELRGKRVAAIGTGASAIQFVPAIQPEVERLHVFQRTPPWVMPHSNRPVSGWERRLFRAVPAAQRAVRGLVYGARELLVLGFAKRPRLIRLLERLAHKHMGEQISDPELLEKVRPDYTIGCKRILPSNGWYPALESDNVELVTDPIAEVGPDSVTTADGQRREVDAIILGTGFQVTEMPAAGLLRGRDGRTLQETWGDGPRAYLGCTVAGFPNFFLLLGPNTGLGHGSMVYMIESQIAYVLDALGSIDFEAGEVVELRPEAQDSYNARLDRELETTVWNTGCESWYFDASGRNAAIWPDWTWRFRRRTARFDPHRYRVRRRAPERAAA